MLGRSTLSRLAKEKGHRVRVMSVVSAVEHIFNEIALHARAQASNRLARANRASHGPRVRAKKREKITREKSQGISKGTKGAKGSYKGKTSKTGLSSIENSKSEISSDIQESALTCPTDTSWNDGWNCDEWHDGWSFDEWNDDWSSVGWHEGWEQTYDTSASSFSLGGLDLGATSSPKLFEWVKMNLDTGAAVDTFPLNFGPSSLPNQFLVWGGG